MHVVQLAFQHSDTVEDEGDARDKYTVHQLFRNFITKRSL